jgi:3-oxoacyl-[acyl-carrier protein] reductase
VITRARRIGIRTSRRSESAQADGRFPRDDAFAQAGGRVDGLINNVGDMAADQTSWRKLTEESIDHVLAVDIKGTMLMTNEFGVWMIEEAGARSRTSARP